VLPRTAQVALARLVLLLLAALLVLRPLTPRWSPAALGVDLAAALVLLWRGGLGAQPRHFGLLALALLAAHGLERTCPARIGDVVAPAAIGGLWLAYFFSRLDRRPPAPLASPQAPAGGVG
jgi:hypothetical protein